MLLVASTDDVIVEVRPNRDTEERSAVPVVGGVGGGRAADGGRAGDGDVVEGARGVGAAGVRV